MSKKSSIIDILEHEMNRIYFEATNLEKSKRIYSDIWNRFACLVCCKTYAELSDKDLNRVERYVYDYLHPQWKPILIDGKDSGYQISNIGDVIGKRGEYLRKDIAAGYYRINGYYDSKPYRINIHREVAIAFIPNPENKPQVNHINGNKLFDWAGNLEWVTPKENTAHAVSSGLMNFRGSMHPENVYSVDQIHNVCKLLENPSMTNVEISNKTNVNRSIVYSIRHGRSWTHISSKYNIYRPRIRKSEFKSRKYHRKMSPKTKFIYESINNGSSKDEIANILMRDYGFTDRSLAMRSINKVIFRHMRDN